MAQRFNFNRKKFAFGTNSILARDFLKASGTLDFPSVAAAGVTTLTVSVNGASVGDACFLGFRGAPTAGLRFSSWVSAADVVTVQVNNLTAGAVDAASAVYDVLVVKAF